MTRLDSDRPRILVVLEDDRLAQLVRAALRSKDFAVLDAPDGLKGFDAAVQKRPDLVIFDLLLPAIDGWRLAEQLAANESTANIPRVLLSGMRGLGEIASELNVDAYLSKPVDVDDLLETVERLISDKPRGRLTAAS
ncbi:MAG: response regulator [Dehalococcoidia bacterium]|nr:response regulator [Dehalococcoidia bacterium]MPZ36415.1 response regulator [Rhodospirillales bacterium]